MAKDFKYRTKVNKRIVLKAQGMIEHLTCSVRLGTSMDSALDLKPPPLDVE